MKVKVPVFDPVEHRYTYDGNPVPSVTQIMRPLTEAVYGKIDPATLQAAADFGTAVHACTEYLDEGDLDANSVEPEWIPYVEAYIAWKDFARPTIERIEWRLACEKYAGTIDRIVTINGEPWVVDIKTTTAIHPHVGVQLAAYEALASAACNGKRFKRGALQLRGDGTFRFMRFEGYADATCFQALLNIHAWKSRNEIH